MSTTIVKPQKWGIFVKGTEDNISALIEVFNFEVSAKEYIRIRSAYDKTPLVIRNLKLFKP